MKKKRFLKLVMSYGIQRDEAARMAARVGEFGSYEAPVFVLAPVAGILADGRGGAQGRPDDPAGRPRFWRYVRRNGDSPCRLLFPCFARVC